MQNLLILKMEKKIGQFLNVFGLKSYIFNAITTSDVFLYTVFSVGCNAFSSIPMLKWENILLKTFPQDEDQQYFVLLKKPNHLQ